MKDIHPDAEVVFHLDPSDESPDELLAMRSRHFRLIQSDKKLGFAAGLNLALSEARHEKILRMDADDISLPWRWRIQVKALDKFDFHFGSIVHKFQASRKPLYLPNYPVALGTLEFREISKFRNPGFHPASAFRKSLVEELGGYRNSLAEDYDLWLRALAAGHSFRRGLVPVLIYVHHEKQATASEGWEERVARDSKVIESMETLRDSFGLTSQEQRAVFSKLFLRQPIARLEFRDIEKKIRLQAVHGPHSEQA